VFLQLAFNAAWRYGRSAQPVDSRVVEGQLNGVSRWVHLMPAYHAGVVGKLSTWNQGVDAHGKSHGQLYFGDTFMKRLADL